MRQCDCSKDTC